MVPLLVKYKLSPEFPTYYSHSYLNEEALGRKDLKDLDAANRQAIKAYLSNIDTMEKLTRINTNLRLLKKHQQDLLSAEKRTIDVEVVGLRIGDFVLVTFPGELVVDNARGGRAGKRTTCSLSSWSSSEDYVHAA